MTAVARGYQIGADIGGTFTDVVATDGSRIWHAKASTTPHDLAHGLVDGLRLVAHAAGLPRDELLRRTDHFSLATTTVTNTLAERNGLRVGVVATRGFRDLLHIARGHRGQSLDYWGQRQPPALAEPSCVAEVGGRIDRDGNELWPVDDSDIQRAITYLVEREHVEALAVCLLWSFKNPEHERRVRDLAQALHPGLFVTLSSDICPVIREYERMVTSIINSYSSRRMADFAERVEAAMASAGLRASVWLMQSNGGVCRLSEARGTPAFLLQSGPAGGVIAAQAVAAATGEQNVVTADMGGTSFDVSIIAEGKALKKTRAELFGLWTGLDSVDVDSIGSGGGSIARVDVRRQIRVGPESAGAEPGPACYGRGGDRPTITDALVVLGLLRPDKFLGGTMLLDAQSAESAVGDLGSSIGLDAEACASGIFAIALETMIDGVRQKIVYGGYDPRDFVLMSYGGCGPLFGPLLARELGIREVVIPWQSSVFSAFGVATADVERDVVTSVLRRLPVPGAEVEAVFADLETRALGLVDNELVPRAQLVREAALKFGKQAGEVSVRVPDGPLSDRDVLAMMEAFAGRYEQLYGTGTAWPEAGTYLVTCRLRLRVPMPHPPLVSEGADAPGDAQPDAVHDVLLPVTRRRTDLRFFAGRQLGPGAMIEGPAVIELPDTTIFVDAGMRLRHDPRVGFRITFDSKSETT